MRYSGTLFPVLDIHAHPTADLAVVKIESPDEREITWPVHKIFDDQGYGTNVCAFGFAEHRPDGPPAVTPRYFAGYVQRYFNYSSPLQYRYLAAELSFRCPGGLSGAHVLNPQFTGRLYGVITENITTSIQLDSVLEVDDAGKEYKESLHNIINYGIALWIPACAEWLDGVVPPVPVEEVNRRAKNQPLWNTE